MSTPISYITLREDEGYKPAKLFKRYKTDNARPIAAILSLNTIANTIGAAGVGHQVNEAFGSQWFTLVSVVTTILIGAAGKVGQGLAPPFGGLRRGDGGAVVLQNAHGVSQGFHRGNLLAVDFQSFLRSHTILLFRCDGKMELAQCKFYHSLGEKATERMEKRRGG